MNMLLSGLLSALTGIYFLFLPVGGYQGGRNPFYDLTILFDRQTWDDIHTWSSVAVIALVALHIPLHWNWIVKMTKSGFRSLFGRSNMNNYSQFNLGINVLIGTSGLICTLSGLYFLLVPLSYQGLLFSTFAWDMIHTWSGVVMISAGLLHFGIHWKWVTKVLGKYIKAIFSWQPIRREELAFSQVAASTDDNR
jgi:hypothetical protein